MNSTQFTKPNAALILALLVALLVGLYGSSVFAQNSGWIFNTSAGQPGATGSVNGVGTNALFNLPQGIAVDRSNNVYVADDNNNVIRKITPAGMVSTLPASFASPVSVQVDSTGNLFILEWIGHAVRKITPAGIITTFVPGGGGYESLSIDSSDNLYLTATLPTPTVFKVAPAGTITTVRSGLPTGVFQTAVDSATNIFLANADNTISKLTLSGVLSIVAGSGIAGTADGTGTNAQFNGINSLVVDSQDTLYVTDTHNNTIRIVSSNGVVTTIAGWPGHGGNADGLGTNALFNAPASLALDTFGSIFVSDSGNQTIRKGIGPPFGVIQPQEQAVPPGGDASFTVAAVGGSALFFQWFFNTTNQTNQITGQTNSTLVLTNLTLAQMGNYSVVVSNSFGAVAISNAYLTVLDISTPLGDNIPNWWKVKFGLSLSDSTLATNRPVGDQLTYIQKYFYGLNPLTRDTDGDGVSDYDEVFAYHTNPLSTNTTGDGIPDGWKIQHGLNPVLANANDQISSSGVSYGQIYQYDLLHTNQLDPQNLFFAPGTSAYEVLNNGSHTNRYYYDHEDRLRGAEYSKGISIGYSYDGNGNMTNQTVLSRRSETNGLPVLWRYLNGLTNDNPYIDSDGDAWTDYQEWLAGTDPNNTNSIPKFSGNPGTNIASLTLPFTPTNFVVGVGKLSNSVPQIMVISGDGNPGSTTNFLLVLTQSAAGWSTQEVSVGSFGVTSIAIGQPPGRPSSAIYCGLRASPGTLGRIVEFVPIGTNWQQSLIAVSTNVAPVVSGIVTNVGLVAWFRPTNSLTASAFALAPGSSNALWTAFLTGTNNITSTISSLRNLPDGSSNFVFAGESDITNIVIEMLQAPQESNATPGFSFQDNFERPNGSVGNGWQQCSDSTATSNNLVIQNGVLAFNGGSTAGVFRPAVCSSVISISATVIANDSYRFSDRFSVFNDGTTSSGYGITFGRCGSSCIYSSISLFDNNVFIASIQPPFTFNGTADVNFRIYADGSITGAVSSSSTPFNFSFPPRPIVSQGSNFCYTVDPATSMDNFAITVGAPVSQSGAAKPQATGILPARGSPFSCGAIRPVSHTFASVCYAFVDDQNTNGFIDQNDQFVVAEYLLGFTNNDLLSLSRLPIASAKTAQNYGLTCVNFLNTSNEVLFTGEPDGQIFAWTAVGTTNPLQRELFSPDYFGNAWHALTGVKTMNGDSGLAGLMVDPTNANVCNVIYWSPQTSLPQLPIILETAPFAAVIPSSKSLGSNALVNVRLWDNEGNASTPFLQYQYLGATDWHNATLNGMDGSPYSSQATVAAQPGGSDHALVWNAFADVGGNRVTNVLLRARAQDFMLVGDWSLPTPFQLDTTLVTNPIPSNSPAIFTGAGFVPGGFAFSWQGTANSTFYIQRSPALTGTNAVWVNIYTGLPPTPISGDYTDLLGTNQMEFYRMKIGSP